MLDLKALGERVKQFRLHFGMTQQELGERLGVSAQAVSKWENGLAAPDITLLPAMSACFGISIDTLLGVKRLGKATEDTPHTTDVNEVQIGEVPHTEASPANILPDLRSASHVETFTPTTTDAFTQLATEFHTEVSVTPVPPMAPVAPMEETRDALVDQVRNRVREIPTRIRTGGLRALWNGKTRPQAATPVEDTSSQEFGTVHEEGNRHYSEHHHSSYSEDEIQLTVDYTNYDKNENHCMECHSNFDKDENHCMECHSNFDKDENHCMECHSNFDKDENHCMECHSNFDVSENHCTECHTNFDVSENHCMECHTNFDASENHCTECHTNFDVSENHCTECHTNFDVSENHCTECHTNFDVSENHCMVCHTNFDEDEVACPDCTVTP